MRVASIVLVAFSILIGLVLSQTSWENCGEAGQPECSGIVRSSWTGLGCRENRVNQRERSPPTADECRSDGKMRLPFSCSSSLVYTNYDFEAGSACSGNPFYISSQAFRQCLDSILDNTSMAYFCASSTANPTVFSNPTNGTIINYFAVNTQCNSIDDCSSGVWKTYYEDSECQNATSSFNYLRTNLKLGICYDYQASGNKYRNLIVTVEGSYLKINSYVRGCSGTPYFSDGQLLNTCVKLSDGRSYKYLINPSIVPPAPVGVAVRSSGFQGLWNLFFPIIASLVTISLVSLL